MEREMCSYSMDCNVALLQGLSSLCYCLPSTAIDLSGGHGGRGIYISTELPLVS